MPLDLAIEAAVGSPLRVTATAATGAACRWNRREPLAEAAKHPLTAETLAEQFGRLGKTPYELRRLDAKIDGRPMIPLSVLGKLRHEMVRLLDAAAAQPPLRTMAEGSALAALRAAETEVRRSTDQRLGLTDPSLVGNPAIRTLHLHVLCRSMEQIEAALACGVSSVIVDFRDIDRCGEAVRAVHAAGAEVSAGHAADPQAGRVRRLRVAGRMSARRRAGAKPCRPGFLPPHRACRRWPTSRSTRPTI